MIKYKDLEIIGFSGKIGVGKNYMLENVFAPMLQPKQTVILAFADHFKIDVVAKDKVLYEHAFHNKTEYSRSKLQHRGTEEGRNVYGENIWVDAVDAWIQTHYERGIRRIFLSDCRFENECEYIRNNGGVIIRVNADDRNEMKLLQESNGNMETFEKLKNHISEKLLDNYDFDFNIDNSMSNTNVFNEVRDIVIAYNNHKTVDTIVFCDVDDTLCHCYSYYVDVLNKVLEECRYYIKPELYNNFVVGFKEVLNFLERNMQFHYIYKERYAQSMAESFGKFNYMFKDDLDVDMAKDMIYQIGMSVFNYTYEPLDNSIEIIKKINDKYKVVFVTVGSREEQVKKLAQLGLSKMDFEIFDHKDQFVFRNLCNKYKADKYVMIGDSINRDIEAPIALNFHLVLHVDINMNVAKIKMSDNHYKISHISEGLDLLLCQNQ